ncbi:Asr1405/Asl0597 family protein [Nostoc sp. UHCC 0302]|uniref:Asr1405/Asl0597 family protein n=1 Tax=Nostoc sp. UHCC 0302 TaxID=3134896 RepID=UPI00311CA5D8
MKSSSSEVERKHIVNVDWADRWQVYQRLQELQVPCCCETNQPLRVEIASPTAAFQLWSVMRGFTASRQQLIWSLEQCWQIRYKQF